MRRKVEERNRRKRGERRLKEGKGLTRVLDPIANHPHLSQRETLGKEENKKSGGISEARIGGMRELARNSPPTSPCQLP